MPFPIVYGIPRYTSGAVLIDLRKAIVASLTETMGTPVEWNRPFFVADSLGSNSSKVFKPRLMSFFGTWTYLLIAFNPAARNKHTIS